MIDDTEELPAWTVHARRLETLHEIGMGPGLTRAQWHELLRLRSFLLSYGLVQYDIARFNVGAFLAHIGGTAEDWARRFIQLEPRWKA